ncbi:hypothetical protein PTKIN_Ptkin05aG0087500 [Pterospermum kingtungense]
MLMSMFSLFEALWADSHGHTMKFTAATLTSTEQAKPRDIVSSLQRNKKETDSKDISSTDSAKKPHQQHLKPRFAPELDGVNCFETIIPY